MAFLDRARHILFGKPLDPLGARTRHNIALVAFFAWVGLGADGISSSCYGPEEAFRALGEHAHLGLYLALATAVTVFVIALAYNQVIELFPTGGGGYRVATSLLCPYAGLEAVSNNVNTLAEPRVRTGKVTMLYMAISLAFTAGGIILLYLLWDATPVEGQTLNAVTFGAIIESLQWESRWVTQAAILIVLALEAGLLFVAANTGFLGGPAVLANMAFDS